MHMSEENWKEAQSDFFESFKNYDEAGSMQRIQVLKYLVLTTMLMKSTINPFDSQETKPYKNDPRISAMTDLVDAYQRDDIHRYESILKENQDLLADPFIAENIDEVSRNMRSTAVLKLVAPYTRFTLKFISKHVKIPVSEVEDILGVLIVDKKLDASINQEDGTVKVNKSSTSGNGDGRDGEHLQRLHEWTRAVESLWTTVLQDGEGFKFEETQSGANFTPLMNFNLGGDAIPTRGPVRRGGHAGFRGGGRGSGMGGMGPAGGGGKLFTQV